MPDPALRLAGVLGFSAMLACVGACGRSERGADTAEISAIRTSEAPTPDGELAREKAVDLQELARLDGESVKVADFSDWVSLVRHPGYHLATLGEARRLLRVYLGERAMDRETRSRGFATDPAGREAAFDELLREFAQPVVVRDEEIQARVAQARATLEISGEPSPKWSKSVGEQLTRSRRERQRRAILDRLLERSHVGVNQRALEALVASQDAPRGPPATLPPNR